MPDDEFHVYDTTLRDGAQQEGLTLTVADKLAIARRLDEFGVGFIEGGWPGAIPKDTEFFRRARTELDLRHAQLAAFGATRRPGVQAADDPQVAALRESGAPGRAPGAHKTPPPRVTTGMSGWPCGPRWTRTWP
jgi:2-isopropylmalate synthase